MSYFRVIPRDFFNESKLLKCLGQLALKVHDQQLPDNIIVNIEESGEPFAIQQDTNGDLFIANYPITINGVPVPFSASYNSKNPYPLFCEIDGEIIEVFNDHGGFTNDFFEAAGKMGAVIN